MDQLYLIEILVDKVKFEASVKPVPKRHEISLTIQFGNIANFEIKPDELCKLYGGEYDKYRLDVDFNSGKSYLFPSKADVLVKELEESPLQISLNDVSSDSTDAIGEAVVQWNKECMDMVYASRINVINLQPTCFQDVYTITHVNEEGDNENIAQIELFVRLSCHGQGIETQFQVMPRENVLGIDAPPKRFLFKSSNADTTFQARRYGEEGTVTDALPVAPIYHLADPQTWNPPKGLTPEELTADKLKNILCKNPHCPGAQRFKQFGIGPAATGAGLGTMYGSTDVPVSYGLSHTYGNLEHYGPYGFYSRPKQLEEPFIPKDPINCKNTAGCGPCCNNCSLNKTNENSTNNNGVCRCGAPLRLTGGGPVEDENKMPEPMTMCKDLLQSFDQVLNAYRKALGPCGQVVCPFAPNIMAESCKRVCNHTTEDISFLNPAQLSVAATPLPDSERFSACGTPSCPYNRKLEMPTEKQLQSKQIKSACGSPVCPYAKQKAGTATDEEVMEMNLMDGPKTSKVCGNEKCPFSIPAPAVPELEPIHWDCPDPLPKGACRNPQCPLKPKELRYDLIPRGPCGSSKCPYATPPFCGEPTCPYAPPQPCPYASPPSCPPPACPQPTCPPAPCPNAPASPLSCCGGPASCCPPAPCPPPPCPFQSPCPPSPCPPAPCPFLPKTSSPPLSVCGGPASCCPPAPCPPPPCPFQSPCPPSPCPPSPCPPAPCPFSNPGPSLPCPFANMPVCSPTPCPFDNTPSCPPPLCACGNPNCPSNPPSCGDPTCPYNPQPLPCSGQCPQPPCAAPPCPPTPICGVPNCPYAPPPSAPPCSAPTCPYAKPVCPPQPPAPPSCGDPNCPFAPPSAQNQVCSNPSCPYASKSNGSAGDDACSCCGSPSNLQGASGVCTEDDCPFMSRPGTASPVCSNPCCPFAQPPPLPQPCCLEVGGTKIFLECAYEDGTKTGGASPKGEDAVSTIEGAGETEHIIETRDEELEPCNPDVCGRKVECSDCGGGENVPEDDGTPPFRERSISGGAGGGAGNGQNGKKLSQSTPAISDQAKTKPPITSVSDKVIQGGKKNKKNKKSSKYIYKLGDLYPGVNIGHRECIIPGRNVPAKMGWLWNVHVPCVGLKPRVGWRPGAIGRSVAKKIRADRKAKGLKSLEPVTPKTPKKKRSAKHNSDYDDSDSDATVAPKPTLQIKKREGCYYITMNPLKDPNTLEDNENPYIDCTPMQFKITKNKDDKPKLNENGECVCGLEDEENVVESSSSSSELDIEFTPPAGVIRPERLKRKKDVVHTDTQYNEEDFLPKEVKDNTSKEEKKGKGKKGKKKK